MSEQENSQLIQEAFDALNAREFDRWALTFAEGFQSDNPNAPEPMGSEQILAMVKGIINAFPDLHYHTSLIITQDDYAVVHWSMHGTHDGALQTPSGNSIPPTGKHMMITGSSTYQIKNGKFFRVWAFWDRMSMLDQLGLLPPM